MYVKLFEFPPTRSARVRWVLNEVGQEYESIEDRDVFNSDELKKVHPLGKVPAAVIDGKPLMESAVISTYIADQYPEKELVAKPGTWSRVIHDQWTAFCLTEMEAWLWSTAINKFLLPEEERQPVIFDQNAKLFSASAAVVDKVLNGNDYLIDNKFSVTDIIVGYTVNWANNWKLIGSFKNLQNYLDRLYQQPNCTFEKM